jgi:hypothetical protein
MFLVFTTTLAEVAEVATKVRVAVLAVQAVVVSEAQTPAVLLELPTQAAVAVQVQETFILVLQAVQDSSSFVTHWRNV